MYEQFQRLMDYSLNLMLPLYIKYFDRYYLETAKFNFNTELNSNIVVSNHIPSAFIKDDMSRRVIRFISRLANYISNKLEEDDEEENIKTNLFIIIGNFMIRYARDYLNERFAVPISKLLNFYVKTDFTNIVINKPEGIIGETVEDYDYSYLYTIEELDEIKEYFNSIKKKTLIMFTSQTMFEILSNVPTFMRLQQTILFYPGVFIISGGKYEVEKNISIMHKYLQDTQGFNNLLETYKTVKAINIEETVCTSL
ncbi:MAG TPA: hypothetical protein ENO33_03700 [Hydrogenobaculum sp.]|nr:hypothetical protein [Hydrogenobaculum sp.]